MAQLAVTASTRPTPEVRSKIRVSPVAACTATTDSGRSGHLWDGSRASMTDRRSASVTVSAASAISPIRRRRSTGSVTSAATFAANSKDSMSAPSRGLSSSRRRAGSTGARNSTGDSPPLLLCPGAVGGGRDGYVAGVAGAAAGDVGVEVRGAGRGGDAGDGGGVVGHAGRVVEACGAGGGLLLRGAVAGEEAGGTVGRGGLGRGSGLGVALGRRGQPRGADGAVAGGRGAVAGRGRGGAGGGRGRAGGHGEPQPAGRGGRAAS